MESFGVRERGFGRGRKSEKNALDLSVYCVCGGKGNLQDVTYLSDTSKRNHGFRIHARVISEPRENRLVRNHRWRSTPKYLMLSRPPPPSSSLLIILLPLALTLAGVIWVKHPPLSVPPPGAGLTRAGTVWIPSYS
eukprot:1315452-Amorphochlora_amoeboformis.AAC.1